MRTDLFIHEAEKTSAIFGRNHGLSVEFEGDQACTNGRTVYLPALGHGAEISDDTARVMRGFIDHEAGHVRHTDFDYLRRWAEGVSPLARSLANAIEDIWLERHVRAEYPGSARNLRATATAVNQEYLDNVGADDPRNADPRFVSAVAITWQGRRDYGGETCETCLDRLPDGLRRCVEGWVAAIDGCESTRDNCALAERIAAEIEGAAEASDEASDGDDDEHGESGESSDADSEGDEESDEGASDARTGDESDDQSGDGQTDMVDIDEAPERPCEGESSAESDDDEGEDDDEGAYAASEGTEAKRSGEMPYEPSESEALRQQLEREGALGVSSGKYWAMTTRHDKWHHRNDPAGLYGPVHTLGRRMAEYESRSRYNESILEVGPVVGNMRRKLERALMARERRDWDHGRSQGRLDSKRFAAAVAGRESVFKERIERDDMSTAVSILVDLSGSMYGKRAKMARQTVVAMCEALVRPGIPFEVLGFNNTTDEDGVSYGKALRDGAGRVEPLDMYVFKAFSERLESAKGAVATIDYFASGNNSDGEAVSAAYLRLRDRPEKRKVMIVLSDGAPVAMGDIDKQQEHLKSVVRDIDRRDDSSAVGIGIKTDAVREFYERSIVVNDLEDLGGRSMQELASLLMGDDFVADNRRMTG